MELIGCGHVFIIPIEKRYWYLCFNRRGRAVGPVFRRMLVEDHEVTDLYVVCKGDDVKF